MSTDSQTGDPVPVQADSPPKTMDNSHHSPLRRDNPDADGSSKSKNTVSYAYFDEPDNRVFSTAVSASQSNATSPVPAPERNATTPEPTLENNATSPDFPPEKDANSPVNDNVVNRMGAGADPNEQPENGNNNQNAAATGVPEAVLHNRDQYIAALRDTLSMAAPPVLPESDIYRNREDANAPAIPEYEVIKFNLENGALKRFMDIVGTPEQHNPTANSVLQLCFQALKAIRFDSAGGRIDGEPEDVYDIIRNTPFLKNSIHYERASTTYKHTKKPDYHLWAIQMRCSLARVGEALKAAMVAVLSLLYNESLIYEWVLHMEQSDGRLAATSVERVFSMIVHLIDASYERDLMKDPDFSVLQDIFLQVPTDIPSFDRLLNNIPKSHLDENAPRAVHTRNRFPHPTSANIQERNSANGTVCQNAALTKNSPLVLDGSVDGLLQFCRENPGGTFEVQAATGSGKTLSVATRLCDLGTVTLVMLNDLHVKMTVKTLKKAGFRCEVRTERYAKFGNLPKSQRDQIFKPATFMLNEVEDAVVRCATYQPMRAHPDVELYVCTYKVLRQLMKNADLPDVLILDDVRCDNKDKDLAMFNLINQPDQLPHKMIVGGLSSSDYTAGRFNFDEFVKSRDPARHLKLSRSIVTPFPVAVVPEYCEHLLRMSSIGVISRLVSEHGTVRAELLDKERPDLLPVMDMPRNKDLFEEFDRNFSTMELDEFAEWIKNSFLRRILYANKLKEFLDIVASRLLVHFPQHEHTRLLDSSLLEDVVDLYVEARTANTGAMLLFLPSSESVVIVARFLRTIKSAKKLQLIPIVGPWSTDEILASEEPLQIQEDGTLKGRIILLSPESESSLTFKHVSLVVDSGLKHIEFLSNEYGAEYSMAVAISIQEELQRRGRAGRLQRGLYLKLNPLIPPSSIPGFLSNDPDSYQVEMRTIILEILHYLECRGLVRRPKEITELTRIWFPNMNTSIIDAALNLIREDGICLTLTTGVTLTPLGHLVAILPGTYDENYLVATGAAYGCFRSMAAYVVARHKLDLWNADTPRAREWKNFFSDGIPLPDRSHLDFVESVMYWYLKTELDNLAAIRADVNPAHLIALKHDMRAYEVAMFAYSVERDHTWDWTVNDGNSLVRRMALFSGSHGNMCLLDAYEHMLVIPTGHVLPCNDHDAIRDDLHPSVCKIREVIGFGVFTKLRPGGANSPDKFFGLTDGGFLLPLLFIDSSKPRMTGFWKFDNTFVLRKNVYIHGDSDILKGINGVRTAISDLMAAWQAGSQNALEKLTLYIRRIANFLEQDCAEMREFLHWNRGLFWQKNPVPPAGLAHRRSWCPMCLHQAHKRDQCLAGEMEVKRRHQEVRDGLLEGLLLGVEGKLPTPYFQRSMEVAQNNYFFLVDEEGRDRCCQTCGNLWHHPHQCRSYARADGCMRCGEAYHTHNDCTQPEKCSKCGIKCHLTSRCEEDRLMVQQLYHMPFVSFLKRIYGPRNNLNFYNNIGQLVLPQVSGPYFLHPRNEVNGNPNDRAGPERHICEKYHKGFI